MARRLYCLSSGSAAVTPADWEFANQINPLTLPGTLVKNTGSAMTTKTEATGTTNPTLRAMFRWVFGPLKAQTISGTVKGNMRGSESNAGANATPALAIKIIKPDGTDRAILLAPVASDSATSGHEYTTSLTNMTFQDAAESASISLTSGNASEGDYLVIEVGFRSATSTSRNISQSYGNDSATDLPEDTSTTAANNPWVEFSANISFIGDADGAAAGAGSSSVVAAAIWDGAASSSAAGDAGGVGLALWNASGSATAAASDAIAGASVTAAVGASVGQASDSVVSGTTLAADATATGTAEAAAEGENGQSQTVVEADGASDGAASASIVGAAFATADASSAGEIGRAHV